jgi:hypothetical protein
MHWRTQKDACGYGMEHEKELGESQKRNKINASA